MPSLTPDPDDRTPWRQAAVAVLFLGLAVGSMHLSSSRQREVASAVRSTVLRPFVMTREALARARHRAEETSRLRREVDSLVSIIAAQRPLAEENRRLREQLDLAERLAPGYEPANLLRAGTEGSRSMFLVDVGRTDGVRSGSPVIVRDGLVGVIRDAGARRALGMDWTHPEFRASAMTEDGAIYGIVERREGEHPDDDRLVLTGIPFHTVLTDGDRIVTSGRGGIYPRGIPIGTVDGMADEEGGWRKSYWIRPAVEPGGATHVLVAVPEAGAAFDDLRPAMRPGSEALPADTPAPDVPGVDASDTLAVSARSGGTEPDTVSEPEGG